MDEEKLSITSSQFSENEKKANANPFAMDEEILDTSKHAPKVPEITSSNILHLITKAPNRQVISFFKAYILKEGAFATKIDFNQQRQDGRTPLQQHISSGSMTAEGLEYFRYLLDNSDIELPTSSGQTPLLNACVNQKQTFITALIDKGAQLDTKDKEGLTPLIFFC